MLIEYGEETPGVADFALYQELCATAIARGTQALRERVAERAQEAAAARTEQPDAPSGTQQAEPDELSELERKHRGAMRTFAASAHAANLDLGDSLRDGLSVVDPTDIKVARFFVYALLGAVTAATVGTYLVLVMVACGVTEILVLRQPRIGDRAARHPSGDR